MSLAIVFLSRLSRSLQCQGLSINQTINSISGTSRIIRDRQNRSDRYVRYNKRNKGLHIDTEYYKTHTNHKISLCYAMSTLVNVIISPGQTDIRLYYQSGSGENVGRIYWPIGVYTGSTNLRIYVCMQIFAFRILHHIWIYFTDLRSCTTDLQICIRICGAIIQNFMICIRTREAVYRSTCIRVARYPVFQGSSRISASISSLPEWSYPGDEISRISVRTCQSPVTTHGDTLYGPCIVAIAYMVTMQIMRNSTVRVLYNTTHCTVTDFKKSSFSNFSSSSSSN